MYISQMYFRKIKALQHQCPNSICQRIIYEDTNIVTNITKKESLYLCFKTQTEINQAITNEHVLQLSPNYFITDSKRTAIKEIRKYYKGKQLWITPCNFAIYGDYSLEMLYKKAITEIKLL